MKCLSIIIVSYNTCGILRDCLNAVTSHPPAEDFEIIVVDNASTDGSPDMVAAEFPGVRLIVFDRNSGYAAANNAGIRESSGRVLAIQNSDVMARPGLYDGAIEYMNSDPGTGILGPKLLGPSGGLIQMSWSWIPSLLGEIKARRFSPERIRRNENVRKKVEILQRRTRNVQLVFGACMFLRREMLDTIGLFDENFVFYYEESDLCLRARRAGWKIVFLPRIEAVHLFGASQSGKFDRSFQIYRQSQMYYFKKHFGWFQAGLVRLYLKYKFSKLRSSAAGENEKKFYDETLEIIRGERRLDFQTSRKIGGPDEEHVD